MSPRANVSSCGYQYPWEQKLKSTLCLWKHHLMTGWVGCDREISPSELCRNDGKTLHSLMLPGWGSTLLLSIAWWCFFHHTSPGTYSHAALISISILIHGSVYLLAGVCGDSQAIGHKARCFVLLHQPHRNDGDSHLMGLEKKAQK